MLLVWYFKVRNSHTVNLRSENMVKLLCSLIAASYLKIESVIFRHILKIVMIQTCFYRWFPYRGGGVYQSIETPAWCRSSYYFHSYFYGSPKLGSSLGLQRHSLRRSEHELRHECVHQGWFSNWFGPVGCADMVHISEVL